MPEILDENEYKNLIKKAYIEPIKSVLAIDDQYQSLDTVLSSIKSGFKLTSNAELSRQIDTLDMVRANNWLADMHSGQTDTDSKIFERLHQCDLLLLDYHLDESNPNDPEKALTILSKLNENHHFNLVIVYTGAENLSSVRTEIFAKLSSGNELFRRPVIDAERLILQWETDGESYADEMLSKISLNDLVSALSDSSSLDDTIEFSAIFSPINIILESISDEFPNDLKRQLYIKLLQQKMKDLKKRGDFLGLSSVIINRNNSDSIWLKTEKLFISVLSKDDIQPAELPNALVNAIQDWRPTCHRLLLSKIKSELDDNGQSFENEVLNCKYTNAGWLEQFYADDDDGTQVTVSRLMEGLTSSLKHNDNLHIFASELKSYIKLETFQSIVAKETNHSIEFESSKRKIRSSLNAYICSQKLTGKHLAPGHIIEWIDNNVSSYFICLTPACDLVPRDSKGWKERLGNTFPVKLLKLEGHDDIYPTPKAKIKNLDKDIASNNHLFIKIDSNVFGFSYSKDQKSNPHWEQCYAENRGHFFDIEGNVAVSLARTQYSPASMCLESRFKNCRVVGQLRYEYALNLVNKLGANLTRVGLDFVNLQ